jgi:hypothetical protein
MKFYIKHIKNGVVLQAKDGDICYQESYDGDQDHDAFADFLRIITENFGPTDGRHGKKRIYITVRHGDKYDCHEKPCEYCIDSVE